MCFDLCSSIYTHLTSIADEVCVEVVKGCVDERTPLPDHNYPFCNWLLILQLAIDPGCGIVEGRLSTLLIEHDRINRVGEVRVDSSIL